MGLKRLKLRNVRNLENVDISPMPGINVIAGPNGSGKTSLLEAIHLLGLTASFRTNDRRQVIANGTDELCVEGVVERSWGSDLKLRTVLSGKDTRVDANGRPITRSSELAALFPVTVMGPEDHEIFEHGPKSRRQFMDRAMFHVEPRFFEVWKTYYRVLRHRNAALKRGDSVSAWDVSLVKWATELSDLRRDFVSRMSEQLKKLTVFSGRLPEVQVALYPGWPEESGLLELLEAHRQSDIEKRHTQWGPHRADVIFRTDQRPAQEYLSRGQRKALGYFLKLAVANLTVDSNNQAGLVLVDDLPAELDMETRSIVLRMLYNTGLQSFITTTDAALLSFIGLPEPRMFHVEHGTVTEVPPLSGERQ